MPPASTALLFVAALATLAGCSDSPSTPDAGPVDTGVDLGVDTGVDAGPPDLGPPPPCLYDQGGEANRGCDPGEVCNIETGQCVPGKPCTSNSDCNACSALRNPENCGHGYSLTAWCDPGHGNVCTRSRSPCEPCRDDDDCGLVEVLFRQNPDSPDPVSDVNRCLDYGDGKKFCGRPFTGNLSCPPGFTEDQTRRQCVRESGCPDEPLFCPRGAMNQPSCPGRQQICPGESCPNSGGGLCATNDFPGSVGICLGFCDSNDDCPPDKPICNLNNGLCGTGCTKGSCAPPNVCHLDGQCAPPCETDRDCFVGSMRNPKIYGTEDEVYCNLPGRPAPRLYKGGTGVTAYRDDNSCAPLGCERATDCPQIGIVCDTSLAIPECVPGCFDAEDDCRSGEVCRRGIPGQSYSREQCRGLPEKSEGEIGACCFPGCTNRTLQCDLNQFCCGEPGSPYQDESTCPPLVNGGMTQAEPGECFDLPRPPFCFIPDMNNPCSAQAPWTFGYNSDPDVMGGRPFREQEFAFGVAVGMMNFPVCGVTCDPEADDNGCPRGWNCNGIFPGCLQDADCGAAGITCEGEDTSTNPPRPGRCKCGENNRVAIRCPTAYGGPGMNLGTVENPRCRDPEGDGIGNMFCLAAYNCQGPSAQGPLASPDRDMVVYPEACGL